jgi:cytochrome c553
VQRPVSRSPLSIVIARLVRAIHPAVVLGAVLCVGSPASAADARLPQLIAQCAACHGADGNSATPNIPSLAGQPEFFLFNQLFLMREGVRQIPVMAPLVKDLSDAEIEGLAKHFAALPPKPSGETIDRALVQRARPLAENLRCASCHLPTLAGQDQMPRLAKQRIDYMIAALKSFRDNTRSGADTMMTAVVVGLSDAELEALAHYASAQ